MASLTLYFFVNRYRSEKKSLPQDCVSLRGHFAPRLFLLSSSFPEINSNAKIRMALMRHIVLYRLIRNLLHNRSWGDLIHRVITAAPFFPTLMFGNTNKTAWFQRCSFSSGAKFCLSYFLAIVRTSFVTLIL